MTEVVMIGIASALGALLLLYKMGFAYVLGFDLLVDGVMTAIMMYLYAGTAIGMMTAMFAGLIISLAMLGIKKTHGYMKPTLVFATIKLRGNWKIKIPVKIKWVPVPGVLYNPIIVEAIALEST